MCNYINVWPLVLWNVVFLCVNIYTRPQKQMQTVYHIGADLKKLAVWIQVLYDIGVFTNSGPQAQQEVSGPYVTRGAKRRANYNQHVMWTATPLLICGSSLPGASLAIWALCFPCSIPTLCHQRRCLRHVLFTYACVISHCLPGKHFLYMPHTTSYASHTTWRFNFLS